MWLRRKKKLEVQTRRNIKQPFCTGNIQCTVATHRLYSPYMEKKSWAVCRYECVSRCQVSMDMLMPGSCDHVFKLPCLNGITSRHRNFCSFDFVRVQVCGVGVLRCFQAKSVRNCYLTAGDHVFKYTTFQILNIVSLG